jgi:hypothetical protein
VPAQRRARFALGGFQYEAWEQFFQSVQTGQSAFEKLHGLPIFEYYQQHSEDGKLFDAAMTGIHGRETATMLDAYDFSGIGTLADLCGGRSCATAGRRWAASVSCESWKA